MDHLAGLTLNKPSAQIDGGIRASLRNIAGMLSLPSQDKVKEDGPCARDARTAMIAPTARSAIVVDMFPGLDDAAEGCAPPPLRETERTARHAKLRADAHAAFGTVNGSVAAALDTALAVVESELRAVQARCDAHAEMLKAIRLYSPDAASRAWATRGLEACEDVLADRRVVEAGCPRVR